MVKILKNLVTLTLAVAVCLSATRIDAFAEGTTTISADTKAKIAEQLQFVEANKAHYNLSNVDFEKLAIGNPVHCYEYVSTGFNELRIMYPLLFENTIVAFAIPIENTFQINTSLAEKIAAEAATSFAVVYDDNGCYLYTVENGFTLLVDNSDQISTRANMETLMESALQQITAFSLTNILRNTSPVGYISQSSATRQSDSYVGCTVSYVSQNPYSYICWAATIACISNCVNGTNLTAVNVAQAHYGTTNFNQTVDYADAVALMASDYNLLYAALSYMPSDTVIAKNLRQGYPLFAFFRPNSGNISHAVCLYGIDLLKGYAYLMNPSVGFDSATYTSAGYQYVSVNNGATYTMEKAGVRYAA